MQGKYFADIIKSFRNKQKLISKSYSIFQGFIPVYGSPKYLGLFWKGLDCQLWVVDAVALVWPFIKPGQHGVSNA